MARYEETFNQADSTTLGPALTWTKVVGTWDTLTQRLRVTQAAGGPVVLLVRAEHDTTTSDQSTEVTFDATGSGNDGGPAVRFQSAASTAYYTYSDGVNQQYISKVVAGTQTNLSNVPITLVTPATLRIEVFGTTLRSYYNGARTNTITDSSITAGTRGGVMGYNTTGNALFWTKFTTQDFSPVSYDRTQERFPGYRPPLGALMNLKIPRPQFDSNIIVTAPVVVDFVPGVISQARRMGDGLQIGAVRRGQTFDFWNVEPPPPIVDSPVRPRRPRGLVQQRGKQRFVPVPVAAAAPTVWRPKPSNPRRFFLGVFRRGRQTIAVQEPQQCSLLLESGSNLLLESGSGMLAEGCLPPQCMLFLEDGSRLLLQNDSGVLVEGCSSPFVFLPLLRRRPLTGAPPRGKSAQVVPPQVAVPKFPLPVVSAKRLRGALLRRGRRSDKVPAQAAVVAPTLPLPAPPGRRLRGALLRRGRTQLVIAGDGAPPVRQQRRAQWGRRKGRVFDVPVPQVAPVAPTLPLPVPSGKRLRGALARRGRSFGLPPNQRNPLTVLDYFLWADASDLSTITATGGVVTQINDKSVNGNHLVGTTGGGWSGGPTTNVRQMNGLNALLFSGVQRLESIRSPNLALPATIFVVGQSDTLTVGSPANRQLIGDGATTPTLYLHSGPSWAYYDGNEITGGPADINPVLMMGEFNGASSQLRVNGAQQTTGNPGGNGYTSGRLFLIGDNVASGSASWAGLFCEVLAYPRVLSAAEIQSVEAYLIEKWFGFPYAITRTSMRRLLVPRRGKVQPFIPAQAIVVAPTYPPQTIQAKRLRGWLTRRSTGRSHIGGAGAPHAVVRPTSVRRGLLGRRPIIRNHVSGAAGVPHLPVRPQARKPLWWLARRGKQAVVTPPQVVVPPYRAPVVVQPRRQRGWLFRRGHVSWPTPTQQPAPNPPWAPPVTATHRSRLIGAFAKRGRRSDGDRQQGTVPSPRARSRLAGAFVKRGRRSDGDRQQGTPAPSTRARLLPGLRRTGRPVLPPVSHHGGHPTPQRRSKTLSGALRVRRSARSVVPVQEYPIAWEERHPTPRPTTRRGQRRDVPQPPIIPLWPKQMLTQARRLRGWLLRRGRTVTPVQRPPFEPPDFRGTQRADFQERTAESVTESSRVVGDERGRVGFTDEQRTDTSEASREGEDR